MKQLTKKELKRFFKEVPKRKQEIVLILENVQYERNVAAIFRTADAAGVSKIYLTGISKQPPFTKQMEHVSRFKEKEVEWKHEQNAYYVINQLKRERFLVIAVELTNSAMPLDQFKTIAQGNEKIALVVGSEMFGITKDTLKKCDMSVFIPMYGKGASLNVATSVGIALYSF